MTPAGSAPPLAWAYICTRVEARRAIDRHRRRESHRLRMQAAHEYRRAIAAGGPDAAAAKAAQRLLGERRDLNNAASVWSILATAGGRLTPLEHQLLAAARGAESFVSGFEGADIVDVTSLLQALRDAVAQGTLAEGSGQ